MAARSYFFLACLCTSAGALAADDVSALAGRWQVDRLVTSGIDRHLARSVTVTFDVTLDEPNNYFLIRGDVYVVNSHTFTFKADGQRLVAACELSLCTSTLRGIRAGRAGGPPPTPDQVAAVEKLRANDEFLRKLFVENDAYWSKNASGITIGFVMADTRIELSRYDPPSKQSVEP